MFKETLVLATVFVAVFAAAASVEKTVPEETLQLVRELADQVGDLSVVTEEQHLENAAKFVRVVEGIKKVVASNGMSVAEYGKQIGDACEIVRKSESEAQIADVCKYVPSSFTFYNRMNNVTLLFEQKNDIIVSDIGESVGVQPSEIYEPINVSADELLKAVSENYLRFWKNKKDLGVTDSGKIRSTYLSLINRMCVQFTPARKDLIWLSQTGFPIDFRTSSLENIVTVQKVCDALNSIGESALKKKVDKTRTGIHFFLPHQLTDYM